ncbi:hypothetical protein B566_EDAN018107 [Ephemera danica]|nr:hypothetical protein B566_EDAN018107 [Ephemera danica]
MMIRLVTLLLVTVAVAAQDDRIPNNVIPISYNLKFLRSTLANSAPFQGTLEFVFTVTTTTNVIQLHSQGLVFANRPTLDPTIPPGPTRVDTTTAGERVTLTFTGGVLQAGVEYKLTIKYDGQYNDDDTQGFYSYQHPGEPPWTPGLPPGWPRSMIVFQQTRRISPHVVAWIITKHSTIPTSDTRISVWHRPSLTSTLLDVTVKIVSPAFSQLETYLKPPGPTDKLDFFTVANTKFSGMENFGLPIFREAAIIFEDGESSSDDRQRICQLVTHEIAQQWFGDLVTPKWWDEVWLSEGFATYFEYFTLAEVEKDWEMKEQFVVQQTQVALQADWYSGAYTNAHAGKHRDLHPLIIPNVKTKEDIERVFDFDTITLSKGASVVRMLNAILGEDTFKKNLRNYLNKRAEGNVDTAYLWERMGASLPSGTLPDDLTLAKAMEKWATQTGFPEIVATRDYGAETVKITQSQFLLPPHKAVGNLTWNVPIFWITEKDSTTNTPILHWLQPDVPNTNEIKLPSVTDEQWLLINKDHAGFYRVNYDQKNWQLLSESYLNLTTSSRAMLLDDALNLARGGRLDYVTALDVTELLPSETDFAPWSAALSGFSYLYDRLSNDTESREVIEKYILEKLTYIYDYIGGFDIAPAEPHTLLLMKQLILHWACRVGHVTCIRKADDLFNSWILSSTSAWRPTTSCPLPSKEGELEVSKAFSEDLAPKLNTPEQLKQVNTAFVLNNKNYTMKL